MRCHDNIDIVDLLFIRLSVSLHILSIRFCWTLIKYPAILQLQSQYSRFSINTFSYIINIS